MTRETLLFFDVDGTLLVNAFSGVIFPAVVAELQQKTGRNDPFYAAILAEHDRRLDHPLENLPMTMDWEDIFQTIASRYGVTLESNAEKLVIAYAFPPHISALDNAPEVLKELSAETHRTLLVSTMGLSKYQFPVLKALGLYDLFDEFLTPDRTGALKNQQKFYAKFQDSDALRIHIGDRYDHDCLYPHLFGAKTVLRLPLEQLQAIDPFERPAYLPSMRESIKNLPEHLTILPDAVVVSLAELPDVVKKLELSQPCAKETISTS